MRRLLLLGCCATFLASCAKSDTEATADTAAAAPTPALAAPASLSLADVAGKWNVRVMAENSDSVVTSYVLDATADTAGWKFTFPNRPPIAMRNVVAAGDSIVTDAGPFDSAVRKGAKVANAHTVVRMQGGNLVGNVVAQYQTTGPDSVARLRLHGTRAP